MCSGETQKKKMGMEVRKHFMEEEVPELRP